MKNTLIILALLTSCINYAVAQDFHLSQYNEAPLYLNPALTGVIANDKNDRAFASYRTQWGAVTDRSFTTFSGGYDRKLNDRFSIGGYIINNNSGLARINAFSFFTSAKYSIIEDVSKHRLDVGLQLGLLNRSIRSDNLTFESQYSNADGGINSEIPSGEVFNQSSLFRFNANTGVYYEYNENKKLKPFIGVSLYNIVMPKISFFNNDERLALKTNIHLGAKYIINEKWTVSPMLLLLAQQKARELNVGVRGDYLLNESGYTLIGEAYYRHKDAVILGFGLNKDKISFKASYDINISYLSSYTNSKGAIEFSLVYSGLTKDKPKKSRL
jgi:type IX secretion system PorP/SprF family membrane protein